MINRYNYRYLVDWEVQMVIMRVKQSKYVEINEKEAEIKASKILCHLSGVKVKLKIIIDILHYWTTI